MRQYGVFEVMGSHVCVGVWGLGRAEQRETHNVSLGGEAVFAVVEDGDAVGGFGEVGPFVAAYFEFGLGNGELVEIWVRIGRRQGRKRREGRTRKSKRLTISQVVL